MTALALGTRLPTAQGLGRTAAAFGLGVLLLVVFLLVAGFNVIAALEALWNGAFGSWYAFTSVTLVRATPLILLGLAFTLGSRAGALNIGMEGQFAVGAVAATWLGLHLAGVPGMLAVPAVMLAGALAGAAWVAFPALLRLRFGVTEVISTLLLNFVADAVISYAVTGPLQEPSRVYPESAAIAASARLPHILPASRLHFGFVLVLIIAGLLWLLLQRTSAGFKLRAAGAGPVAARVTGKIATIMVLAIALLGSGALAGLGGAMEVSGVSYALYQNLSPGYGFTAIAVALLGAEEPLLVVLAGLLFGALDAGAGVMQRDAGIPAVAVQVVEAVVLLTVVISGRRKQ